MFLLAPLVLGRRKRVSRTPVIIVAGSGVGGWGLHFCVCFLGQAREDGGRTIVFRGLGELKDCFLRGGRGRGVMGLVGGYEQWTG